MASDFDHHMMGIALAMARRGLGTTAPNPSVGAVLVEPTTGAVLARGTTAPGGRPHAERIALERAGADARGATLYVTLEPCSHHGQTAPCADAVMAAGIARVVCGVTDPDPRVAGRGLAKLRAAGIEVEKGVRAREASAVTRGHILRVSERRPFVQLKLALGGDGTVPLGQRGRPVFATGDVARATGHLMRARADAILVGAGTVVADDPELTCRLPGLSNRSPQRIVLAHDPLVLVGTRLAASAGDVPVAVYSAPGHRPNGAHSAAVAVRTAIQVGGRVWLPSVLEDLAARGVTRLLVEGGPRVWRAFAEAGLADEVVMFVGGAALLNDAEALTYGRQHLGDLRLAIAERRTLGCDAMWRLTLQTSAGAAFHSPAYPRS